MPAGMSVRQPIATTDTALAADVPAGFQALGLGEDLLKTLTSLGYEEPTPIQREAVPHLLAGRDLLGQAGTGTGKTAAFALPLIHRLVKSARPVQRAKVHQDETSRLVHRETAKPHGLRGLILVPTRELAMQVADAIRSYSKGTSLKVVPLYGGAPM